MTPEEALRNEAVRETYDEVNRMVHVAYVDHEEKDPILVSLEADGNEWMTIPYVYTDQDPEASFSRALSAPASFRVETMHWQSLIMIGKQLDALPRNVNTHITVSPDDMEFYSYTMAATMDEHPFLLTYNIRECFSILNGNDPAWPILIALTKANPTVDNIWHFLADNVEIPSEQGSLYIINDDNGEIIIPDAIDVLLAQGNIKVRKKSEILFSYPADILQFFLPYVRQNEHKQWQICTGKENKPYISLRLFAHYQEIEEVANYLLSQIKKA